MLFFILFAFCTIPAISHTYTVKVKGKVELGEQLANLFQEICTNLFNNMQSKPIVDMETRPDKGLNLKPKGDRKIKIYKGEIPKSPQEVNEVNIQSLVDQINKIYSTGVNDKQEETKLSQFSVAETSETPLLDLVIGKKDNEKVHVYGKHKQVEEKQLKPLNNINI